MNDTWKTSIRLIKPFLPMIGVGLLLIGLIYVFKPSIWVIITTILIFGLLFTVINLDWKPLLNSLQGAGFVLVLYGFYQLTGGAGFLGLFVALFLIVIWILYKRRKLFMKTIRDIEIMIWGKTNDRKRKP